MYGSIETAGLIRGVDGVVATGGQIFRKEFEVALPPGNNEITVAAFNQDGVRSKTAALPLKETRSMYPAAITTLHVLAVGINEYAADGFNLRFARPDAESLAEALDFSMESVRKSGQALPADVRISGPPSTMAWKTAIHVLKDREATRQAILDSIRQIAAEASPSDSVILFYAGHSTAQGDRFYLLPHDMRPDAPESFLSDRDLEAAMPAAGRRAQQY